MNVRVHISQAAASSLFLIVLLLTPAAGRCEFPIDIISNSSITGDFFQPAGFLDGSVIHLAFIGSADGNPPYKVYYCPINGAANFNDENLTGDTIRLKDITLVDGIPTYGDGRTPWVFPLTDNGTKKVGIIFIGDSLLYFSLINPNLADDLLMPSVDDFQVIPVTPSTNVTSLSSASDSSGNLHMVYADSGDIYYASLPFNDFSAPVDSILLDSSVVIPQLAIDTDSSDNAHAIWASDTVTGRTISYYAMIDPDSTAVPGKVLIPKTRVFGQEGDSFTSPWISVTQTTSVYLSAVNGSDPSLASEIFLARVNPNLAPRDGSDLVDPDKIFSAFPSPLGLDFQNPVVVADNENRVHVSGGGGGGTGLTFASAQLSGSSFTILENQKPISLVDLPEPLDGFDRASLSYFTSGKAVIAWSGLDSGSGDIHIFATSTTAPAFPPQPAEESGCTVRGHVTPSSSGTASALLLLLPALILLLSAKVRRRFAKGEGN